MVIDDNSPMTDVLAGMKRADYNACYAFCQRQKAEHWPALIAGAEALSSIAHTLACEQPDALMAWKFPKAYAPVPGDALPAALDAAAEGDTERVYTQLRALSFADLMTVSSAAGQLVRAARHLQDYGPRPKPDPQGRLF